VHRKAASKMLLMPQSTTTPEGPLATSLRRLWKQFLQSTCTNLHNSAGKHSLVPYSENWKTSNFNNMTTKNIGAA
jgi:hypothetical protein